MKPKMICKIVIDIVMTLLLLVLMARQATGDSAHEWLGAGMFVIWIAHHILNFHWHRQIGKGKYSPFRILQLGGNLLLCVAMLGTMVSGIILSREVFAFLPISGGLALAVYGLYAFVKNQFLSYMLLLSSFVFFDFERPLPLFFAEYLANMGLFIFLAHYGAKALQSRKSGKRS